MNRNDLALLVLPFSSVSSEPREKEDDKPERISTQLEKEYLGLTFAKTIADSQFLAMFDWCTTDSG